MLLMSTYRVFWKNNDTFLGAKISFSGGIPESVEVNQIKLSDTYERHNLTFYQRTRNPAMRKWTFQMNVNSKGPELFLLSFICSVWIFAVCLHNHRLVQ